MPHLRRALITLLIIALIGVTSALAQIPLCSVTDCVYLPQVDKPYPTPTATNTPIATTIPTITPSPTQQPTGVQILANDTSYVDSINYLHIVGEVVNYTSTSLRFVKIAVNVFNGGQLVGTDFTYTYLDSLPPNTRTCFHILLQQPSNWTSYQFERPTYSSGGSRLPNLTVLGDSGSYNPTYHWYTIIGQVRNDESSRVRFVQPVATLYNATGKVVGCDFTYVNSTDLDPGQTSSFSITTSGRDYSDVASYRLQVDGQIQ